MVITLILLVEGTFMETVSIVILMTPILLPIMKSFGYTAVLFGIILLMNTAIGSLTPPLSVCLFTGCRIVGIRIEDSSVSLGIPGQLDDPRVKEAIRDMIRRANAKGVYAGMLGKDPEDTNEWFACGADYIVQVGDMSMYYRMCEAWVKGVKGE